MAPDAAPRRGLRRAALVVGVILLVFLIAVALRVALRTPAIAPPLDCIGCGTLVACETVDIPVHFSLGWAHLNHRISRIGVGVDGEACTAGSARVHMIGGDFSTGEVFSDHVEAELSVLRYTPAAGESAGWVRVAIPIDAEGQAGVRLPLDLRTIGIDDSGRATAVVGGFLFRTDVPQGDDYPSDYEARLGYTSRGFGVDVALDPGPDGTAALRVDVRFEHGAASDAWFRSDMNRAMRVARTEAWVDVVILSVAERRSGLRHRVAHALDRPWRWTRDREPLPSDELLRLPEAWSEGVEHPVAFSGWDFTLDLVVHCTSDRDCDRGESCTDVGVCTQVSSRPGDYVRQFEVGLAPIGGTPPDRLRARVSTATRAVGFRPLSWSVSVHVEELALRGELSWWRSAGRGDAGTLVLPLEPVEGR